MARSRALTGPRALTLDHLAAEPLWVLPAAAELPDGVIVSTLDAPEHRELIERHLGSLVSPDDDAFVALNDAGARGERVRVHGPARRRR